MMRCNSADLELLLSFALLDEDWFQDIVHLLWWSILAVAHTYAGQQDELLDTLLGCSLDEVDVALPAQQMSIHLSPSLGCTMVSA